MIFERATLASPEMVATNLILTAMSLTDRGRGADSTPLERKATEATKAMTLWNNMTIAGSRLRVSFGEDSN